MSKIIVIVGFGPGISASVAERFGMEGFSVALIARNESQLVSGVEALKAKGIAAAAFAADAGDPSAIREAIGKVRTEFGPITVIHWNAFGGGDIPDLVTADPTVARGLFDIAVVGILSAVQAVLPDLKNTREGAILITNGALGEISPEMDEIAAGSNTAGSMKLMGVALANAAKNKLVGMLAQRLKGDGVYVGQVMIAGTIKGTAWDTADSIDPSTVAGEFWEMYQTRGETRVRIS